MLAVVLSLVAQGCVVEVTGVGDYVEGGDKEASQLFSRTIPVEGQTSFRLVGANGSVRIVGLEGIDEVRIHAVRRVRSDTQRDAEDHLHLLRVRVHTAPEKILVETDQPQHSGGRSYVVDYELEIPAYLCAEAVNGNGAIHVQGIREGVVVEVGNGNVTLQSVEGSAFVAVGNGQVEARVHLPPSGQAVVAVGNGSVDFSVQPEVSAQFNAQVGNGTISVSGLSLTDQVSSPGQLSGRLGSGDGLINLSVGNGWVAVKGS
jgi:hypothetical protein